MLNTALWQRVASPPFEPAVFSSAGARMAVRYEGAGDRLGALRKDIGVLYVESLFSGAEGAPALAPSHGPRVAPQMHAGGDRAPWCAALRPPTHLNSHDRVAAHPDGTKLGIL